MPAIISMDVDGEHECKYRIQYGSKVKYVDVAPGTFDRDTLSFPLSSFPPLPYDRDDWSIVHISRNPTSGELMTFFESRNLDGVREPWHANSVNILDLSRVKQLNGDAFECTFAAAQDKPHSGSMIAKIARFEWEIRWIAQETKIYKLLQGSHIAPRFLGHIHEQGRVMGLLVEKVEGMREAGIEDLERCKAVLESFHALGMVHGNVNRNSFLVPVDDDGQVRLIDFGWSQVSEDADAMRKEIESLQEALVDKSRRVYTL